MPKDRAFRQVLAEERLGEITHIFRELLAQIHPGGGARTQRVMQQHPGMLAQGAIPVAVLRCGTSGR